MTCVFATLTLFVSAALADSSLISLIDQGRFRDAETSIQKSLSAPNLSASERWTLEFERERMRRMRLDFKLTKAEALER